MSQGSRQRRRSGSHSSVMTTGKGAARSRSPVPGAALDGEDGANHRLAPGARRPSRRQFALLLADDELDEPESDVVDKNLSATGAAVPDQSRVSMTAPKAVSPPRKLGRRSLSLSSSSAPPPMPPPPSDDTGKPVTPPLPPPSPEQGSKPALPPTPPTHRREPSGGGGGGGAPPARSTGGRSRGRKNRQSTVDPNSGTSAANGTNRTHTNNQGQQHQQQRRQQQESPSANKATSPPRRFADQPKPATSASPSDSPTSLGRRSRSLSGRGSHRNSVTIADRDFGNYTSSKKGGAHTVRARPVSAVGSSADGDESNRRVSLTRSASSTVRRSSADEIEEFKAMAVADLANDGRANSTGARSQQRQQQTVGGFGASNTSFFEETMAADRAASAAATEAQADRGSGSLRAARAAPRPAWTPGSLLPAAPPHPAAVAAADLSSTSASIPATGASTDSMEHNLSTLDGAAAFVGQLVDRWDPPVAPEIAEAMQSLSNALTRLRKLAVPAELDAKQKKKKDKRTQLSMGEEEDFLAKVMHFLAIIAEAKQASRAGSVTELLHRRCVFAGDLLPSGQTAELERQMTRYLGLSEGMFEAAASRETAKSLLEWACLHQNDPDNALLGSRCKRIDLIADAELAQRREDINRAEYHIELPRLLAQFKRWQGMSDAELARSARELAARASGAWTAGALVLVLDRRDSDSGDGDSRRGSSDRSNRSQSGRALGKPLSSPGDDKSHLRTIDSSDNVLLPSADQQQPHSESVWRSARTNTTSVAVGASRTSPARHQQTSPPRNVSGRESHSQSNHATVAGGGSSPRGGADDGSSPRGASSKRSMSPRKKGSIFPSKLSPRSKSSSKDAVGGSSNDTMGAAFAEDEDARTASFRSGASGLPDSGTFIFGRFTGQRFGRDLEVAVTPDERKKIRVRPSDVFPVSSRLLARLHNRSRALELLEDPLHDFPVKFSAEQQAVLHSFLKQHGCRIDLIDLLLSMSTGIAEYFDLEDNLRALGQVLKPQHLGLQRCFQEARTRACRSVERVVNSVTAEQCPPLARRETREFLVSLPATCVETLARTLSSYEQLHETAMTELSREMAQIRDGSRKKQLASWWLTLIRDRTMGFLADQGYRSDVLPDSYIDHPPDDMEAVQKCLQTMDRLLDDPDEKHGLRAFAQSVAAEVYPRIDSFIRDAYVVLCTALEIPNVTVEQVLSGEAAQMNDLSTIQARLAELSPNSVEPWIPQLVMDLEYLLEMKRLEGDHASVAKKDRLDNVPITGLVVGKVMRVRQELRTAVDVWGESRSPRSGSPRVVQSAAMGSGSANGSAGTGSKRRSTTDFAGTAPVSNAVQTSTTDGDLVSPVSRSRSPRSWLSGRRLSGTFSGRGRAVSPSEDTAEDGEVLSDDDQGRSSSGRSGGSGSGRFPRRAKSPDSALTRETGSSGSAASRGRKFFMKAASSILSGPGGDSGASNDALTPVDEDHTKK